MSNSSPNVESLYNKSLNQLCETMNEEVLQNVLKWLPPSISIQILWKVWKYFSKKIMFLKINPFFYSLYM